MTASDQDPKESPPTAEEVAASAKETRQEEFKAAHEAYMRRLSSGRHVCGVRSRHDELSPYRPRNCGDSSVASYHT